MIIKKNLYNQIESINKVIERLTHFLKKKLTDNKN